jgi:hypothetical protein
MDEKLADRARKGRGAVGNPTGRFEPAVRVATNDGWGLGDEELAPLRTTLGIDSTRKIITRNQLPDVPFDRSINPYKGCEHDIETILEAATEAGAGAAGYVLLRLPHEIKELFADWLAEHYPGPPNRQITQINMFTRISVCRV